VQDAVCGTARHRPPTLRLRAVLLFVQAPLKLHCPFVVPRLPTCMLGKHANVFASANVSTSCRVCRLLGRRSPCLL